MASARIFFSKKRHQRNGFINEEVPVVENGYEMQESDEDEVFVQDPNLEISASKPLMHPRSKGQRATVKTRTLDCRLCAMCKPLLYFIVLVSVLCGVMATIVYVANRHKVQTHAGKLTTASEAADVSGVNDLTGKEETIVIGCDKVEVEDVWVVGVPKLLTESAFRLVDVNQDGVLDVVLGFATGADGYNINNIVCDLYFGGSKPCFGGILALEGKTGKELWRFYTAHEIYGLNCRYDLDNDGVLDCLVAGRAATFLAISCQKGSLLWEVEKSQAVNPVMNFYTPQYISDINADGVPDVIAVHGGDPLQEAGSKERLSGRILLLSGKTGEVLVWSGVPDQQESYYSPQILTRFDGTKIVLFGTGGETHNGSLWRLEMDSLKRGMVDRAKRVSSDSHKGVMTPPALADVTGDGVEDIVIPMFNSTVLAINGDTFQPLWSNQFPMSETYSTPAVGFYNEDDVPDFLVKYAHGPGYPIYYYSETTVLDGKTGKRLIEPPLRDTIGAQASPLTVSLEGLGNDVFLVWMADCKGHEGSSDEYSFVKGTNVHEQSRSDLCRLRFKSEGFSKLIALGRSLPKNGVPVYNSEQRKEVEHSKWVNTTAEAYEYLIKHQDILDRYRDGWDTTDQWNDPDDGYDAPQERYSQKQQYSNPHRTSSKKGPISRGNSDPPIRGQGYGDSRGRASSRYTQKGSSSKYNNQGGGRGGGYSSDYFPLSQQRGDDYNKDSYSPYSGYDDSAYGSYYPNGGGGYEGRESGYLKDGYPYNYRLNRRRMTDGRRNKKQKRRFLGKKRRRRHVGPHDDNGLQRLLSTGTLAPTLLSPSHKDYNNTIDLIFGTYWFFPAKTQAILPQDQKCISDKLAEEAVVTFDEDSEFFEMTHPEYEQAITQLCLSQSDHQLPEGGIYQHRGHDYNPFDMNMGQMTVYRVRLKFSCSQPINSTDTNTRCANVLPYDQQKWAAYMGSNGDSHWLVPDVPASKTKT